MSEAYTKKEVQKQFIERIRDIVSYWAQEKGITEQDRAEGVAFSILTLIDGHRMGFPALDLALSPHPDDKQFNIDNGEKYYEPQMIINDDVLWHEMFYSEKE